MEKPIGISICNSLIVSDNIPSPTLIHPPSLLSSLSIYISPRFEAPINRSGSRYFSNYSCHFPFLHFLPNNHALSLTLSLSLCLHDFDETDVVICIDRVKDWNRQRDSIASCPSRRHRVSSCDYSLSCTGHDRTRSKGWKCILDGGVYRITTTRTVSMGSGAKIRRIDRQPSTVYINTRLT